MAERLTEAMTKEEIIALWTLGVKYEDDGYGDLGFTLQQNALNEVTKLLIDQQRIIRNVIFPKE